MEVPARSFIGLLTLCSVLTLCACDDNENCNLRPLGTKTEHLPPDSRFEIEVVDVDTHYIPNTEYKIRLFSKDNQSTFIAFTIFVTADKRPNVNHVYRPYDLEPGQLLSSRNDTIKDTVTLDMCRNTLFQTDIKPKTSVQALWIAPPKGNQCVTIRAYLAIKPDVWYDAESPLAKKVCEDIRKADDMQPRINHNCSACEEARYELTFEGTWSFNTHPTMFPKSRELAKFSDIVGASHSKDFAVFKDNSNAGDGLQMMAEQGNTTKLEIEILTQLGENVRTLIKATAPPKPDMTTVTTFRVSREKHLVSLVTSIIPSPDWFLGVANLEVCDINTGTWAKNVRLNLYPFDAGTDSGKDFESSNEATLPHQPITSADITKQVSKEDLKPFAILKVDLVRTYFTIGCWTSTTTEESTYYGNTEVQEPDTPAPPPNASEPPYPTDTETEENKCGMSPWTEWSSCEGECVDNQLSGLRSRFRTFKVDGVALWNTDSLRGKKIPEHCLEERTSDFEICEEQCEEPTTTTEVPIPEDEEAEKRRLWRQSLMSRSWN